VKNIREAEFQGKMASKKGRRYSEREGETDGQITTRRDSHTYSSTIKHAFFAYFAI
jgi:hypothetical protein